MADSQRISREGGEQHLVITHEGEEFQARKRTVYHAEEDEERSEYVLPDLEDDEEYPAAVTDEVDAENQRLAKRGSASDQEDAADVEDDLGDEQGE